MKSIYEGFVKRVLLSIFVVFLNVLCFGSTYYLAPNGNDSNAGTITSPWATLNKVWTVLKAGDTVYLRGGTYAFNTQQSLTGKSGISGSLINVLAYPNETPILTKSASYPATFGMFFSGNYFYWKGIEITGFTQPLESVLSYGFRVENSSYNTFENLKVHGNGCGMTLVNNGYTLHATGNLILNCDFYENQDPLTTGDPYGNADGLSIAWITHPEDVNTVRGCRFWWNSDDGIDMFSNDGQVVIEDCQSFYNGYIPTTFTIAGDGIGYKFGNNLTDLRNSLKRIAKNCISVKNRTKGYSTNGIYGQIELDNCTAYLNGSIGVHLADFNLTHSAKNCISFANATSIGLSTTGTYVTNSWQNGLVVSNADFKSVDSSLLLAARNQDGSLPVTDFLKLASTSKLINAGTSVGIPYSGTAPDLGSYETSSASVSPSVYNVTGGGSFCSGGSGVAVGLSGSQTGVNYQLQLNGVNNGSAVAGTGSALSFGSKTVAGTYTVVATNVSTSATSAMTGSAVVNINPVYSINESISIKEGEAYKGWTVSGQYIRTLTSRFGCDSIVTTNLTVEKLVVQTVPEITQTIRLKKGSNLLSTYLIPKNIDAGVVLKSLIDGGNLYSLQDEDGNTISYSSQLGSWVNNIGAIKSTEGYVLNANNDCSLLITGTQIQLALTISLKPGWNIISYPRTDAVNAMSVIQPLISQNKLVKVQDEAGNSIENLKSYGGWRNNIGNFIPGKAYKVYVNSYASLSVQSSYTKSSVIMPEVAQPEHFKTSFEGNGFNHMNINLVSLNDKSAITAGDELAAFDGNICVGALKITEDQLANGSVSLIASYSTNDQAADGFTEGNQIKIYSWNKLSGNEAEIQSNVVIGELKYEKNGSVLASMKSLTTGTSNLLDLVQIDVFPNPSYGKFTVRFSELPSKGSKIEIVDISGRVITTRPISGTSEEFSLDNQTNGVYLVKANLGSSQSIHKLIVNK